MGDTIPVQILLRCEHCGRETKILRWLPDDNWKELAEIEEKQCHCGHIMKVASCRIVDVKLSKSLNDVYLVIGDLKRKILRLYSNKSIEVFIGNLLEFPYFGTLNLTGKYREPIFTFSFSKDHVKFGGRTKYTG